MSHEKAILVFLAYFNGFIAAFIAFGLTTSTEYVVTEQVVEKHEQKETSQMENETKIEEQGVEVYFKDDDLFVNVGGEEQPVSAKLNERVTPGPGFHVSIPDFQLSPDGKYLYYCEQQQLQENMCHEYLYVVGEHVLRPLEFGGKSLTSSIAQANFEWSGIGVIASDAYVSVSPQTPWILTSHN